MLIFFRKMRNLRLFHYPLSRSLRVLWAAKEMGVTDLQLVRVDIMKGDHWTKEYSEINPNRSVPALEFTDSNNEKKFMFESWAIMRVLAQRRGRHLLPQNENEEPLFEQTCAWVAVTVDTALWTIRLCVDVLNEREGLLQYHCENWNTKYFDQFENICKVRFYVYICFTFSRMFLFLNRMIS
jgi:glutathione S-transferase